MTVQRSGARWFGWILALVVVVVLLCVGLLLTRRWWSGFLFSVSGEESLQGQIRGGLEWVGNIARPRPETAHFSPVENTGMNPFGVNTFLQEEVEPQKRELAVQMMADAGIHWMRQEFTWEDIEIHGKGDFEDRRHEPYQSSWKKYDQIVDLADQYGLEIIARISNPPAWSRAQGDEAGTLAPPDDLDDYGDFVEAVVRRYEGRIHHYQIWNEPNIYPEWGDRPVSPEEYTELLEVGYTRVKETCPDCVVLSGALAQTIPLGPRDLNDFIFLQRMYDAGAGEFFDVLAMQGYGLWSGPTDRRMRPRVLNFSRPLYLREIMVENGDAHKPIWLTEMNWNAPPEELPDKSFGFVTPEQQARYAVLAYQRAQQEWPWLGVVNFWFFKRASDAEREQAMYYFRMVEPDFSPMPVYHALQEYSSQPPVLYPGTHQEDHWALAYGGEWETRTSDEAELGSFAYAAGPPSRLDFEFEGTDLWLKTAPGMDGAMALTLDGMERETVSFTGGEAMQLATSLPKGKHTVSISADSGPLSVDSLMVQQHTTFIAWLVIGGIVLGVGLLLLIVTSAVARRRHWYQRSRAAR